MQGYAGWMVEHEVVALPIAIEDAFHQPLPAIGR